MPFGLNPQLLVGPVSGLVISLVFAMLFYRLFKSMLERHDLTVSELVGAFRAEVEACNDRYQKVLDELLRLKEGN